MHLGQISLLSEKIRTAPEMDCSAIHILSRRWRSSNASYSKLHTESPVLRCVATAVSGIWKHALPGSPPCDPFPILGVTIQSKINSRFKLILESMKKKRRRGHYILAVTPVALFAKTTDNCLFTTEVQMKHSWRLSFSVVMCHCLTNRKRAGAGVLEFAAFLFKLYLSGAAVEPAP